MSAIGALAALVLVMAACGPEPPKTSPDRLAKAEAAMEACKKRVGLADVSTPSTVVLDDPTTRGQALTPELAGQLRLRVQCRLELDELLAARNP